MAEFRGKKINARKKKTRGLEAIENMRLRTAEAPVKENGRSVNE